MSYDLRKSLYDLRMMVAAGAEEKAMRRAAAEADRAFAEARKQLLVNGLDGLFVEVGQAVPEAGPAGGPHVVKA